MIALLINMYLCASGIAMVVAFVCKRFCHQPTPRPLVRASVAVLVGALWPLLILGIAAIAVTIPAMRAARIDPLIALRHD